MAKAGKYTFFATDKIHGIVFCSETLRSRSVDAIAYPSESAAGRDRRKKLEEVKQMIETNDVYLSTVKLEQILNILKQ